MFDFAAPLRALVVGLAGVALAWLWFNGEAVLAIVAAIAVGSMGTVLDRVGRALLPRQPQVAVRFLEWWILTPAAIAAIASAVVVVVTVALTIPDTAGASQDTKEIVGTLSTGLTAFVTAAFISWAGDDKDSTLAGHIRDTFWQKYKRAGGTAQSGTQAFPPGSAGERWVYSNEYRGVEGWGARRAVRGPRASPRR